MTIDEVRELITRGKGPTIEFKREWPQRGDVTVRIGSELVVFANTQGGYLLIGMECVIDSGVGHFDRPLEVFGEDLT